MIFFKNILQKKNMILFYQDWFNKYPHAIIDDKTSNESFLRLAGIYDLMGIKNHAFILSLIHKELQGIDPYDPDLDQNTIDLITLECKLNPWYYLREVAKAPAVAGAEHRQVKANRGLIALWWLFFNHIPLYLIQPRQTGKSFSVDTLTTYLMEIKCLHTKINLLTKDGKLRKDNLDRLKKMLDTLPFYLQLHDKRIDVFNTEKFTIKALGNVFEAHVPQRSPEDAYKMARGMTSPIFLIDEPPFQNYIKISLPAALAAGNAARTLAKANGEPWGTIYTTTAGKIDEESGKYIYQMVMSGAKWSEHYFDCKDLDELKEVIRKSSRSALDKSINNKRGKLLVNATFNHRQLGYTDEWLYEELEESGAVGEDADRDYFNIWTSGTETNPIPQQYLKKITESIKLDHYTEIDKKHHYTTRWFIDKPSIPSLKREQSLVMGLDTSDALGNDDIFLCVRRIEDGGVVCASQINETNLIEFSKWIVSWLTEYQNLTLIIERRSSGTMMIDHIISLLVPLQIDPFKRLFNWVIQDKDVHPELYQEVKRTRYKDLSFYARFKKQFGYATSGRGKASRDQLYSETLYNAAKYTCTTVHDPVIIEQLTKLTTKNGRIDHTTGGHDDGVIAWLLSYWFLAYGRHLNEYGINTFKLFSSNTIVKEDLTSEEYYERQLQNQFKQELDQISEQIKTVNDPYIMKKLENRIEYISKQLEQHDIESISVENLLQEIREKTKLDYYKQSYNPFRWS